jgi:FlaA1/EpsC-like NDP-sugar epimerase
MERNPFAAVETNSLGTWILARIAREILIADLARRMIAGREIRIVITEQRPGDKLEEALLSSGESYAGNSIASLRCVSSRAVANLDEQLHTIEAAIAARDLTLLLRVVGELVPDYEPSVVLRDAVLAPNAVVR